MTTLWLFVLLVIHPFHVGLTDIAYNEQSETYQVSIKLFTDDLEKGLEAFSGRTLDIVDAKPAKKIDSLIMAYTEESFQLFSESRIDLTYIGSEKEYDVTWIYLESDKMPDTKKIRVFNKLLLSQYSDQTHIIHFDDGDNLQSDLIHSEQTTVYFEIPK